jgi:hypothetical protein
MMKTACKISACLVVLVFALISLWATVNPAVALAAGATAVCANGTIKSCSGSSCQSQDSGPGSNGYCFCTRADGTHDVKFCPDAPPVEENAN